MGAFVLPFTLFTGVRRRSILGSPYPRSCIGPADHPNRSRPTASLPPSGSYYILWCRIKVQFDSLWFSRGIYRCHGTVTRAKRKNPNRAGTDARKREDGRYETRASLNTPTGRRRVSFYGATAEDANNKKFQDLAKQANGVLFSDPGRLSVGAYPQSWLFDTSRYQVSERTFERYEMTCRNHLVPFFRTSAAPRAHDGPRARLQGSEDRRGPEPQYRRRDVTWIIIPMSSTTATIPTRRRPHWLRACRRYEAVPGTRVARPRTGRSPPSGYASLTGVRKTSDPRASRGRARITHLRDAPQLPHRLECLPVANTPFQEPANR